MSMKPTFENMEKLRQQIMDDAAILAGDSIGPSDASWQDVAGTMSVNLKVYARLLDRLREGEAAGVAFPSWEL